MEKQWKLNRTIRYRDETVVWDKFGAGTPVVLLHGFPGNSFTWRNVIQVLAKEHTVYVYDLAGFGQSDKRPGQDVSARFQAYLLCWLLDQWNLDHPSIVAHDFGASVALSAAFFDARKFNRVVLLDPAILNPCLRENSRHGRMYPEAYSTMPAKLFAHLMRYILPSAMTTPMDDATFKGYFQPWATRAGQMSYYRYLQLFNDSYLDRLERHLSHLDAPVKIVWGKEDAWIPLEQGYRLQRLLPHAQLEVIPRAGHFIMEDAPDATAKIIQDYLS
jgi:pimeloyl-ACP methyl ester carboxylesterase